MGRQGPLCQAWAPPPALVHRHPAPCSWQVPSEVAEEKQVLVPSPELQKPNGMESRDGRSGWGLGGERDRDRDGDRERFRRPSFLHFLFFYILVRLSVSCNNLSQSLSFFLLFFCSFLLRLSVSSFTSNILKFSFHHYLLSVISFFLLILFLFLFLLLCFALSSQSLSVALSLVSVTLSLSVSLCSFLCYFWSLCLPFSPSASVSCSPSDSVLLSQCLCQCLSLFLVLEASIVAVRMLGLRPQASCPGSQAAPLPQSSAAC